MEVVRTDTRTFIINRSERTGKVALSVLDSQISDATRNKIFSRFADAVAKGNDDA